METTMMEDNAKTMQYAHENIFSQINSVVKTGFYNFYRINMIDAELAK